MWKMAVNLKSVENIQSGERFLKERDMFKSAHLQLRVLSGTPTIFVHDVGQFKKVAGYLEKCTFTRVLNGIPHH